MADTSFINAVADPSPSFAEPSSTLTYEDGEPAVSFSTAASTLTLYEDGAPIVAFGTTTSQWVGHI